MSFDSIPAKCLSQYMNRSNCIIVDIRDAHEYAKGHIPYSINIPNAKLTSKFSYLDRYDYIILYCERGNKSLLSARGLNSKLTNKTILNVYGGLHAYRGDLVKGTNTI